MLTPLHGVKDTTGCPSLHSGLHFNQELLDKTEKGDQWRKLTQETVHFTLRCTEWFGKWSQEDKDNVLRQQSLFLSTALITPV